MSKQQQVALDALLRQGQFDPGADVPTLRAAFNALMAQIPVAPDIQQKPANVGGVGGVEVTIQDTEAGSVILYFHGGVYVIGSAAASVPLVGDLARRAGAKAITLDYRLAPENRYPAAVEDAQAAYEGLLGQGIDPGQIALAGESAGGGLAVATLLALREAGTPLPFLRVLDVALCRSDAVGRQSGREANRRPAAHPGQPASPSSGLRRRSRRHRPGYQPHFRRSERVPPLLIQVGSHEILLSDALRLAARAATADVQVALDVTPGVPHVFQAYAALLDEAGAALDRAASFLKTQFAAAQLTGAT